MDVSESLLVAMMFVVVLTMGIGNILTALAELADRRTGVTMDILRADLGNTTARAASQPVLGYTRDSVGQGMVFC